MSLLKVNKLLQRLSLFDGSTPFDYINKIHYVEIKRILKTIKIVEYANKRAYIYIYIYIHIYIYIYILRVHENTLP